MEKIRYIFSYARTDTDFVLKLAKDLRAVGVSLWLDQLDILGGQRWDRAIQEALETCQGMIAVLSPESVASNNVMDEVSYALEKGKFVLPVLLRQCDVPFRLRRVQYVDFTIGYNAGFPQMLRALGIEPSSVTTQLTAPADQDEAEKKADDEEARQQAEAERGAVTLERMIVGSWNVVVTPPLGLPFSMSIHFDEGGAFSAQMMSPIYGVVTMQGQWRAQNLMLFLQGVQMAAFMSTPYAAQISFDTVSRNTLRGTSQTSEVITFTRS